MHNPVAAAVKPKSHQLSVQRSLVPPALVLLGFWVCIDVTLHAGKPLHNGGIAPAEV